MIELAPEPPQTRSSRRSRAGFIALNRWVTIPLLKAGLGAWLGTPIGGYILLLRVRGRRTGLVREVPLSYLIAEGSAWVLAGWGSSTQWYRNLLADPEAEVVLPGRTVRCIAEDIGDPDVRARMIPRVVRAVGVPGFMGGVNPYGAPEILREAYGWVPLVRLRPVRGVLVAGPDDPGGRAWIWRQAFVLAVALLSLRMLVTTCGRLPVLRRRPRPGRRDAAS